MPTIRKTLSIAAATLIFQFSIFNFSIQNSSFQFSNAQTPLEKTQQDYTFQYSKYRDSQKAYLSAKANYLAYKTATSKSDAFLKTKDYLIQICNVYMAHILLVKEYSNEIDWTNSNDERIKINKIFDDEISYLKDHQKKVENTQVLEDLPTLSKILKDHWTQNGQPRINKVLATYEVTRSRSFYDEFKKLSGILDEHITSKYSYPDSSFLANWRSEIKSIDDETNSYLDRSKQQFSTLNETADEGKFQEITLLTSKAITKLQQSKSLFEEVLRML